MTDPRIAAIDDLLRRYPIDSHGWCGLIVKGSVTWGARVTDVLAAADAVDPRGTQLAELKARLAAVYAITDAVATGQPANPNTGDRDVSWLALVEALCDNLPCGAAGVPEQAGQNETLHFIRLCHCGASVDQSEYRDRGMCTHCDDSRCDAFPGSCGRRDSISPPVPPTPETQQ